MPTAVVRIVLDGVVEDDRIESGVTALRAMDISASVAVSPPRSDGPGVGRRADDRQREIRLIVSEDEAGSVFDLAELARVCADVFGVSARPGVITYISRGTGSDAEAVLRRFDIGGHVDLGDDDDDVVVAVISSDDARRVPESRLRTALEAALNREVRVETSP